MATSQWHKFYSSRVAAPPAILFALLSDLPNYTRWLPASAHFAETTDVEPYPTQLGSRYHDGKPGEPGKTGGERSLGSSLPAHWTSTK